MKYLIILYAIWNFLVFLLYGIDKWKSQHEKWRVPEKTLLLCAFFFGGIGAYLGMQTFRHKTKHKAFTIGVPFSIVVNFGVIYLLASFFTK